MLLILGIIGMGAVAGWELAGGGSWRLNVPLSLILPALITMETRLVDHAISIVVISAAMVGIFCLRFLVLNLLRMRETARL